MNNLNVYSNSKILGGTYDNIRIFGSAEINGELIVSNMDVYGSTKFNFKSEIDALNVFGSCDFKAYVAVKNMDIKGTCSFDSQVKVDFLKVYGSVDFKENISHAKEVNIYGNVDVKLLEADKIVITGVIKCTEQLNCETVDISSISGSTIKEIVGTTINIKPKLNTKTIEPIHIEPIHIEIIDGDNIYLEYVHAKVVRGNKVVIGPHCNIDKVEYKETVSISSDSNVKQSSQV